MRTLTALFAAALVAGAAGAADFTDVAQVVSAAPIMERVSEPRRECGPRQPARAGTGDRVDSPDDAKAAGEHCRTIETTREIVRGYTVVYRYKGREGTTTLPYDPGSTVRVGVTAVDSTSAAPAPRATLGRNVREVRPADATPAPVPSVPAGDYTYRY